MARFVDQVQDCTMVCAPNRGAVCLSLMYYISLHS